MICIRLLRICTDFLCASQQKGTLQRRKTLSPALLIWTTQKVVQSYVPIHKLKIDLMSLKKPEQTISCIFPKNQQKYYLVDFRCHVNCCINTGKWISDVRVCERWERTQVCRCPLHCVDCMQDRIYDARDESGTEWLLAAALVRLSPQSHWRRLKVE